MIQWIYLFFLIGLAVYGIYFRILLTKVEMFSKVLIFVLPVFLIANASMLWYIWGEIYVIGLDLRKLMMFWLGYPEFNLSIKFGLFNLLIIFLQFNRLYPKIKISWHLNFLLCLVFQLFILWKELPAGKEQLINAFYQMEHVLFINSIFMLLLILIYKFGNVRKLKNRNKGIEEKEPNKQKVILFGMF